MPLLKLAQKVTDTYGLAHSTNLGVLRHYIKTTSEDKLIEEIKKVEDAIILRALWEAGLSSKLQEVVLERLKKVK